MGYTAIFLITLGKAFLVSPWYVSCVPSTFGLWAKF